MGPTCPPPQQQLPPALQLHILSFLPPNDRALSGRLVSPDAADAHTGRTHCTASLSQPLPPHAAPWAMGAGQQHVRQLPFRHKLQLLCTAAASGSEMNLEVALALLQPSVFPELLQGCYTTSQQDGPTAALDPGAAAVKAGHPQLLRWLLRHCPNRVLPETVLEAAAGHCDLAGLQTAWGLLREGSSSCGGNRNECRCLVLGQGVLNAAAQSTTPDAVAKMEWLLGLDGSGCSLEQSTAAAAASSGDLGRLRWLHNRGCPVGTEDVLLAALQHADLAVAQWLVDEAGCELPQAGTACSAWESLFVASAKSPDCVSKWQWLRDRSALLLSSSPQLLRSLARAVIERGGVEGLQGLLLLPGMGTAEGREMLQRALKQSRSCPRCFAVAMQLQQAGYVLTRNAYDGAAGAGDLAMVRWLACEAGVPTAWMKLDRLIKRWPRDTADGSRDLLQAVQLLVGEAGHRDLNPEAAVLSAMRLDHIATAQYLLQSMPGYLPGAELVRDAVASGCEALLDWLVEQPGWRAALHREARSMYHTALRHRDLCTLTALRRLGVPWGAGDVVAKAVREGCGMPVLRWLVEQGAPVGSTRELRQAVRCGGLGAEEAKLVQRMALRRKLLSTRPLWVVGWAVLWGPLLKGLRWTWPAAAALPWWVWWLGPLPVLHEWW